jgi:hypothetical protein
MKSVSGGSEVFPLFNGDDLFGVPGNDASGAGQQWNDGKVFYVYGHNEEIFDGFVVKNASGSSGPGTAGNPRTGWYIDNTGGKTIYVERLKVRGGHFNYLLGFGLKSAAAYLHFESGFTLTGEAQPSLGDAFIALEEFVTGLSNLGITAGALPTPLPVISGLKLRAVHSGSNTKNLVDYPVLLAFLNAYMTSAAEKAKLDGLTVLTTHGGFILRKTLPYIGNTIAVSEADKVDGNLAVWLGSQSVALREVYLTNPTLYTSATSIGSLRNVVFAGDNWKHIEVDAASSGVIVSVNTPVKELNAGNENLWYVVQDYNDTSNMGIRAKVDVLEVHNETAATRLIAPNITLHIDGLIVPNDTIKTTLLAKFNPGSNIYNNGARPPNATWADYAASVAAGNTPTFP